MATILIVEDDEAMARIVEHSLRRAGHSPVVACDGRSALVKARSRPDMVLLDLGLPDMAGSDVLRHLQCQADTAGIPVVVVSGNPDAAAIVAKTGGDNVVAVLQKPVFSADLSEVVDTVLSVRAARESVRPSSLEQQRVELIYRLISKGSDGLVVQVCRRLGADLTWRRGYHSAEVLSWPKIVAWAAREKLLGEAERQVLLGTLPSRPAAEGKVSRPFSFIEETRDRLVKGAA